MNTLQPLLSVFCPTYNHVEYIQQTLGGIIMQKTNFQIEVIIQDDASTDGTSEVVKDFADKYSFVIPIIHTVNIYSQGKDINEFFFKNARGKYIAVCEGDDYWTDPLKLQKQVDFLEENSNYALCGHQYQFYHQNSQIYADSPNKDLFLKNEIGMSIDIQTYFKGWYFQTLTTVFRKDCLDLEFLSKIKTVIDFTFFYSILRKGEGYLFSFTGGVYRLHNGGMSTSRSPLGHAEWHYNISKELYILEQTEFLKCAYISDISGYIYLYIKYSKSIKLNFLLSLIRELLNLEKSFYQIQHLTKRIIKASVVRIVKSKSLQNWEPI